MRQRLGIDNAMLPIFLNQMYLHYQMSFSFCLLIGLPLVIDLRWCNSFVPFRLIWRRGGMSDSIGYQTVCYERLKSRDEFCKVLAKVD